MIGVIAASYVAAPGATGYAAAVLADNPLGYWRLGEASGTVMADASPNARHGSYVGSPTLGVPGAVASDTAIDITNGATQYGNVPYAAWMNTTHITIEAWIKPDASGRIVVTHAYASSPWALVVQSGGTQMQVGTSSGTLTATATGTNLYDGNWHHVVGTWDGTTIRVYHDGTEAASQALGGTLNTSTDPIRLGRRGDTQYGYDGGMDEVAVYGTALPADRVAAHYAAATGA